MPFSLGRLIFVYIIWLIPFWKYIFLIYTLIVEMYFCDWRKPHEYENYIFMTLILNKRKKRTTGKPTVIVSESTSGCFRANKWMSFKGSINFTYAYYMRFYSFMAGICKYNTSLLEVNPNFYS